MIAGTISIELAANVARIARDMDQARQVVGKATAGMERAANAAKAALGSIGAGIGLSQIIQMSDQYAKFTAQLRLATLSTREYAAAYGDVKRIATAAQQDLQATGMLYARIANGTRELGTSQKQVAAITETVNMALKVSGATAAESASAQLQLSQAFASGTLRGEEFNAVNEAAPRLMLALADGIGVPVGALKKMAENGLITSKIMADVLPNALEKLRVEAKEVETIAGAFTVLKNNVMEFVGIQANANGGVAMLTGAIGLLANNLGLLAGAMLTLMTARIGAWLAGWVAETNRAIVANRALAAANLVTAQSNHAAATSTAILANNRVAELRSAVLAAQGEVQLALATNGLIPAHARAAAAETARIGTLGALSVAQRAASATTVAFSAVVSALGGPVGAIITLLGLAATAWMVWSSRAKEANDKAAQSTDETTTEMIARINKQIEKLRERNALMNAEPRLKDVGEVSDSEKDTIAAARKALESARAGTGEYAGQSMAMRQLAEIDLLANYEKALAAVVTRRDEMTAADARGRDQKMVEWYAQNGTQAQKLAAELEKLKKEFGSIPPEMEKIVRAKYADKGVATAIKQEATAYQNLVTSIGEKIAANKLELAGHDKLTEAQKMTIKLDEAIASGKNKLTPKHIAEARALISVVEAQDRAIEEGKFYLEQYEEKLRATGESIKSAEAEAERNERLAETFGMTASAVALLELARLEERLAQADSSKGYTMEISELERLIDAKKRSAAAMSSVEAQAASKKATEDIAADYKRMSESIESSLTDALLRGFESGKSFGRNLIDTLKNMFSTLILRPTISGILAPVTGGMASAMMPGAAQAASGGGGGSAVASGISSALGIGSSMAAFGGTLATGFMSTMTGVGLSTSIGAGASMMAGGSIASGLGMVAGALGPIALALAAAVIIWKKLDTSGTYHTGGASSASASGVSTIRAESLGMAETRTTSATNELTASLASGMVKILDSTAQAFGKTAGYEAATAFADDTSKDGAWGALVIKKMGETVLDWNNGRAAGSWAPKEFGDGEAGQKEYLAALSASVRTALDDIGLPSWAQTMLDGLGNAPSIDDLAKVVDTINATQGALKLMGESLKGFADLSDGAVTALMKAAGGIESLSAGASAYYENFYTESEKSAGAMKQVSDSLAAVGLAMPASRVAFRAMVEAQMALGESGMPAVAALFKVSAEFARLHPIVEQVSGAASEATDALAEQAAAMQSVKDAASGLLDGVDASMAVLQRVINAEKSRRAEAHTVTMNALQERIDTESAAIAKHKSLSDAIGSTLDQMRGAAGGMDRADAQAQVAAALAIARAGGALPSADSLKGALSVLSKDSSAQFATLQDYQRDFFRTQGDLAALGAISDTALSVEEKALAALIAQKDLAQKSYDAEVMRLDAIVTGAQEQIDVLRGIDTTGLSIKQALDALSGSILAAQKNPLAGSAAAINDAYKSSLGRAPDAAGLKFWQDQIAGGTSPSSVIGAISGSQEAQVQALYKQLLGRNADAGGLDFFMNSGASIDAIRTALMQSDEYKKRIPGFAAGGDFGGGLRIVGENGPELEATGPSRIFNARQTAQMFDNSEMVAELRALRSEVRDQRAELARIAGTSKRTADTLDIVTEGGNAMRTTT